MRIEPDGLKLLRAARIVVRSAIAPQLRRDRRDLLPAIERALELGEDRLARNAQASAEDLAVLEDARASMRGAVLEALPEGRRFDARLVAQAIAVAARQLAHEAALERREYERLLTLLDAPGEPRLSCDLHRDVASLNGELCARIRAGDADLGSAMYAATLAHLEQTTGEALWQSNPPPRTSDSPRNPPVWSEAAPPAAPPQGSPCHEAVAAWGDVPKAVLSAMIEGSCAPFSAPLDTWRELRDSVGAAVFASGNAALAAPATALGWLAQRLAANPEVPMIVVEGAHQAHDVSVAFAEASMAFWNLSLAPFRQVEPLRAKVMRLP